MDDATRKAAIEAQFLMGHCPANPHMAEGRTTIIDWSWDVDLVRQQLHVPLTDLWEQRVLALEAQGLTHFCWDVAPLTYDDEGNEHEIPGWRDAPREAWGAVSISPRGVLTLAELYGRPYVRLQESPTVLAHWQLVQAESEARLSVPCDKAQWEREWPE